MSGWAYDEAEIRKAIALFHPNGHIFEVRLIRGRTWNMAGVFNSADDLIQALERAKFEIVSQAQAYMTLNTVDPACYARSHRNQFIRNQTPTIGDGNILRYEWLYVDLDPERPADTSSSNEEFEAAHQRARKILDYLTGAQGWPDPIAAYSGNGTHLLYKIDVDVKRRDLIESVLRTLNALFGDAIVKVDTTTANPSRIGKLYGSYARKGADTQERPHRLSRICKVPEKIETVTIEQLEELAALLQEDQPPRQARTGGGYSGGSFDLQEWIDAHGIAVYRKSEWTGGTRWLLETCPFNSEHTKGDAAIIQTKEGKICFNCFHDGCSGRKWRDLRLLYEPDAYQPKPALQNYQIPPKPANFGQTVAPAAPAAPLSPAAQADGQNTLRPLHYTDLGQAEVLAAHFKAFLRHKEDEPAATGWFVYNGVVWQKLDAAARLFCHNLTRLQLDEAGKEIAKANDAVLAAQRANDEAAEKAAQEALSAAKKYFKHALSYQQKSSIVATLSEASPYLPISRDELDADGYILNTPAGTVDLRTGQMRPHDPNDYCTKVTACSPGKQGSEMWLAFLEQLTDGDKELQKYLQMVAGMSMLGIVKEEKLIVAYGEGGNGKSTTFNVQRLVLGDYGCSISADTLIRNTSKNVDYELARLPGMRLVVAAELKEGQALDAETVKRFCSTDQIVARVIRESPFDFTPSHSLVLYTNALPTVDATDHGTWDRIAVVPFLHRFRYQDGEVKNYAECLFNEAGPAVLQWMIDGAVLFARANYTLPCPDCVVAATTDYRAQSSWLYDFLIDCCKIQPGKWTGASDLYAAYKAWHSTHAIQPVRRSDAFKAELEALGFKWEHTKAGNVYHGLTLSASAANPA